MSIKYLIIIVYACDLIYFSTKTQGIVRTPKINESSADLINNLLPVFIGFVGAAWKETVYRFEYKLNPSLKGVKPLETIAR